MQTCTPAKRLGSWPAACAIVVATALVAAPSALAAGCPGDGVAPSGANLKATVALICDINRIRTDFGLRALHWNGRLAGVARQQAATMSTSGTLTHDDAGGLDLQARVAESGYLQPGRPGVVLENIAWGQDDLAAPRAIAQVWMDSEVHRVQLLDPHVTDIAVGVTIGATAIDGVYYAAELGTTGAPTLKPSANRRAHRKHRRRTRSPHTRRP